MAEWSVGAITDAGYPIFDHEQRLLVAMVGTEPDAQLFVSALRLKEERDMLLEATRAAVKQDPSVAWELLLRAAISKCQEGAE